MRLLIIRISCINYAFMASVWYNNAFPLWTRVKVCKIWTDFLRRNGYSCKVIFYLVFCHESVRLLEQLTFWMTRNYAPFSSIFKSCQMRTRHRICPNVSITDRDGGRQAWSKRCTCVDVCANIILAWFKRI